jgi:RNA polymerase sigma-70 factor, ECF subfamily
MDSRKSEFEAMVRAHGAELYRVAYWLCRNEAQARDLVQETCLRAWRSFDRLRDLGAARAWLVTTLRREHARSFERPQPVLMDELPEIGDRHEAGPEQSGEAAWLRAAIARLPDRYRVPLVLQVLGGLSCEEIAEQLELTPQAVMTQVFRAREKLKAMLVDGGAGAERGGP